MQLKHKKTNAEKLVIAKTNVKLQNPGLVADHKTEWVRSYNPEDQHGT